MKDSSIHHAIDQLKEKWGPQGWEPYYPPDPQQDLRHQYIGQPTLIFKPANTQQVSELLKTAHTHGFCIVVQGGNTGRCSGAIPRDESTDIMVNLSRMNQIEDINFHNQTLKVQSGARLADIHETTKGSGLFFPLSLASSQRCQIGGNIATNAGGLNALHYGTTRNLIMGMEAVFPDGRIWQDMKNLKKNNAGYDVMNLLIGSEGTLAIITKAILKLFPDPIHKKTFLFGVKNIKQAIDLFEESKRINPHSLVTFEVMNQTSMELLKKHQKDIFFPFSPTPKWTVFIELASAQTQNVNSQDLIEYGKRQRINCYWAENQQYRSELWRLRESLSDIQKKEGASIKHDISLPLNQWAEFITHGVNELKTKYPGIRPFIFGHLGDGNIHFNFSQPLNENPDNFLALTAQINDHVYEKVTQFNGSIAAEHGIGMMKVSAFKKYTPCINYEIMEKMKKTFDPQNILNPGKIFPS